MGVSFNSKYIKFSASVPAGSYSAEYQIVYDAMTNKPSSEHATAQDNFVIAAVAHGYWTKLQLFHFYAQDSRAAGESLINWISPGTHNGSEVSGIAWTTLQGYTGDGSADCINMNYNPSTQGGKFTQDSASWGGYVRTNIDENARVLMQNANNMLIPRVGNLSYWRINYGTTSTLSNTDSRGFYTAVRSNATTIDYYKNGIDIGGGTAASTVLQNYGFYAVGHPDWYTFSTQELSMVFVGSGLLPAEVSDFYTDFQTLMIAIGTQV